MDLFEVETAFHDVIVLQTVLEEVKNRSLPLYHRLIALTKNEGKRFYVFFNEFRQETHVARDAGETIETIEPYGRLFSGTASTSQMRLLHGVNCQNASLPLL
jgi:hypothetical protein